jgi:hypothetical protein
MRTRGKALEGEFVDSGAALAESTRFDRTMATDGRNRRRERHVQMRRRPLACVGVRTGEWRAPRATRWMKVGALCAERGSLPKTGVRIRFAVVSVE